MAVVLDYAPKPQKQLIWLPTFAAAALFWLIFPLLCWQTRATVDEFEHLMDRPRADEDAWFRAEPERRVWILEWQRNPDHPPTGPILPVPTPTALGLLWNVLIITPRAILLLLHLWILVMVLGPPTTHRWDRIRRRSIGSAVGSVFFLMTSVLLYGRTWSVLIDADTFAAGICWLVSAVVMSGCAILIQKALARGIIPSTAPALGLSEQVGFAAMISPGFAIGVFLCVRPEVAPTLVFAVLAAYWLGVARIAVSRREGSETDQLYIRWGQPFLMGVGALVAIATLALR